MGLYTIDFETTTDPLDCRVWAWGICEVGKPESFQYGNTIESFFDHIWDMDDNPTLYVHNLKFDGNFIFSHLFRTGYEHIKPQKQKRGNKFEWSTKGLEKSMSFTTLISDMGQFYCTKIIKAKSGKKTKYCKIIDSYKILPYSVNDIAKSYGLPINKLKLDYTTFREPGHVLTPHEVDYQRNDVVIMALALEAMISRGLTKMTQGANALHVYKEMRGKLFRYKFPVLDLHLDEQIRKTYKGGYTYLVPEFKEKDLYDIVVLDINSLYPFVMRECLLPVDKPLWFDGEYEHDEQYPLFVQSMTCVFDLKPGKLPTIQIKAKGHFKFSPTEYLKSSNNEPVTLNLTSVDLELFKENYNIYFPVYHGGYKFRGEHGLFTEYVDKWMHEKIEADIEGNKPKRMTAKILMNSLYGKMATSPKVKSKYPVYDEITGVVRYKTSEETEIREGVYIPVGSFITAYARHKTITSAQKVIDKFTYCDTDSLHLRLKLPEELREMSPKQLSKLTTADLLAHGVDIPPEFDIDPVKLGAWKIEGCFRRARFIRAKCYIEDGNRAETWDRPTYDPDLVKEFCEDFELDYDTEVAKFDGLYNTGELHITCAGLPKNCYSQVTWDNFHEGMTYKGKLQPKAVPGGVVLEQTDFTITRT